MSEIAAILKSQQVDEADLPDMLPVPGKPDAMWVVYMWGDPMTLGSPAVPMMTMVTSIAPGQGLVNGWAFSDPSIRASDPQGRPLQFPPVLPVVGSRYNKKPTKMSWMTLEDFGNLQVKASPPPNEGEKDANL
tara:strand:+ start:957 stop:1355 length:399 start_codon:yes stop_codon:yes gene_type:complete